MADHQLKEIADRVDTVLTAALTGYTGISITSGLMKPGWLPTFDAYAVRIAPNNMPWTERAVGIRNFQYTYRFDLYLLCKVTDEDLSLWGTGGSATKGIFQLVEDVKAALRGNSLSGYLDRSFEEMLGDVQIENAALQAFESAERVLIHRARVPYTPRTRPFCVPL